MVVRFNVFLSSANLICRSKDISKCLRESLRDNESRLYILNGITLQNQDNLILRGLDKLVRHVFKGANSFLLEQISFPEKCKIELSYFPFLERVTIPLMDTVQPNGPNHVYILFQPFHRQLHKHVIYDFKALILYFQVSSLFYQNLLCKRL